MTDILGFTVLVLGAVAITPFFMKALVLLVPPTAQWKQGLAYLALGAVLFALLCTLFVTLMMIEDPQVTQVELVDGRIAFDRPPIIPGTP